MYPYPKAPHSFPPPKKERKKRWRGRKGLEISVVNRQHPVNFTHMSLCDTYSVSIKLKTESITKKKKKKQRKNLSDYLMSAATTLKQIIF